MASILPRFGHNHTILAFSFLSVYCKRRLYWSFLWLTVFKEKSIRTPLHWNMPLICHLCCKKKAKMTSLFHTTTICWSGVSIYIYSRMTSPVFAELLEWSLDLLQIQQRTQISAFPLIKEKHGIRTKTNGNTPFKHQTICGKPIQNTNFRSGLAPLYKCEVNLIA